VFLIGIADHAGPLVTKGNKKRPKATLKHKTNLAVRPRFFMVPSYLFGTALTCHFVSSMQCAQQSRESSLCGFHVAFHMLRLLDDIPGIRKAAVSR
jgi:hypothetical protein